jgi:myosin heavy subunit
VEAIEAPDNSGAIDLLGAKGTGILSLLDQAGDMLQPSDEKFNEMVHREHQDKDDFSDVHAKDVRHTFAVSHYAAEVTYTVGTFLEKNNDTTPVEVEGLLTNCSSVVVKEMFVERRDSQVNGAGEGGGEGGSSSSSSGGSGDGGSPENERLPRGSRRLTLKKKKQTISNVFTQQVPYSSSTIEYAPYTILTHHCRWPR